MAETLISEFATELFSYCEQLEHPSLKTALLNQFHKLRSDMLAIDLDDDDQASSKIDALITTYINEFTLLCPNKNLVHRLRKMFLNEYIAKLNRRVELFIRNNEINERLHEILGEMESYHHQKLTLPMVYHLKSLMAEYSVLDAEQKALVVESEQIRVELEAEINE